MLFATAELGRSKGRFGALTIGAGLLIFVLLFMQSLLAAVLDGMAGAVKAQSGPVIVFTKDARRNFGGGQFSADKVAAVKAVPGVGAVGELGLGLFSYRTATSGDVRTNVSAIGYRPGQPGTPTTVSTGRLPEGPDEIVASTEGAQGRFAVGDTLTFEPGAVPLKVVGLTEGALMSMGPAVWVQWDKFDELMKQISPTGALASVVAVQPADGTSNAEVIANINKVSGLDAMTRTAAAEAAPGRKPIEGAFLSVMTLVYVVVGIVISFFFLTMTLHKEQSITMLRAVGANAGYLISCLLYEVAVVMIGGTVVGVGLLYLVKPALRSIVIINIDPGGIVAAALPALVVAAAGTLPPIRRMLRTDPNAVVSRPTLGSVG